MLGAAFLLVGLAFALGGTVGLVRLPDLYTRAHAAGKCDTAGAGSILLALALLGSPVLADLKLLLLVLLIAVTTPTTAHALARSANRSGRPPWSKGAGTP